MNLHTSIIDNDKDPHLTINDQYKKMLHKLNPENYIVLFFKGLELDQSALMHGTYE